MTNKFITRHYNSMEIDPESHGIMLRKTSSEKKLISEGLYYKQIEREYPELSIWFPKCIFRPYNHDTQINKILIEYYPLYLNIFQTLTNSYFKNSEIEIISKSLVNVLIEFSKHDGPTFPTNDNWQSLYDKMYYMYITKTEIEYHNFQEQYLADPTQFPIKLPFGIPESAICINKNRCLLFEYVWPILKRKIIYKILKKQPWKIIHGDLCFSNILYGSLGILKLIDPRGSFGLPSEDPSIFGDPRYDLAKLFHSAYKGYGYDAIINNEVMPLLTTTKSFKYNYWLVQDPKLSNILNSIRNSITANIIQEQKKSTELSWVDFDEIDLITGTLFIGMCARHKESPEHQAIMYLLGLLILNDSYNKIINSQETYEVV